jgi:hypothetical protein
MSSRFDRATQALSVALGILTLLGAGLLLIWDAFPERFPLNAHDFLGAFPLAMIALAYLIYQCAKRPPFREWAKAVLLAAAFLFWAANQLWPNLRQAVLFNDIAIGLFVFDVFLVTTRPPAASRNEAVPERLLNQKTV